MKISRRELMQLYRRLYRHYGNLQWWPGDTPLEISVGAILTQNTAWTNVEKAIKRLKETRSLNVAALARMSHSRLAPLIKSAGYFNVKARRLKHFISFLQGHYGGSLRKMFTQKPSHLREELLSVNGVGPETADSILLYAGQKPSFVIDAYTKRILSRHGVMPYEKSYDDFRQLFMKHLPPDAPFYNQYHAMFVNVGKDFCRKKPLCDSCPLNGWRSVPPLRTD
ncbi:MAG: endonuclease III domain-containing protein [Deltaproteobacteria bacterium]|nr:endonuclease III domain-containing protein [Deltaproteobacteria bacterium]